MDKNINFSTITACGECCTDCIKMKNGICKGCIKTNGNCNEWAESKGCPIHNCAKEHNVQFCGLCQEFPCDWLIKNVSWNKNIVKDLTKLANLYYEQKLESNATK